MIREGLKKIRKEISYRRNQPEFKHKRAIKSIDKIKIGKHFCVHSQSSATKEIIIEGAVFCLHGEHVVDVMFRSNSSNELLRLSKYGIYPEQPRWLFGKLMNRFGLYRWNTDNYLTEA